jgi:phosphomannomutase
MAEHPEERRQEMRTCPGEHAPISLAICRTRQRNHYPKCLLCQYRSEEGQGTASTDSKVNPAIFGSCAIRGRVPSDINEYVVRKVGVSAAQFMRSQTPSGSRLLVGCDLRENSRGFVRIFCEGVNKGGMDTVNLGPCPPEMLAFMLGTEGGAGGAFIGAGNSADNVNGIRLWGSDGMPVGFDTGLQKIGLIARRLRSSRSRLPGQMLHASPTQDYLAYVRKFAPKLGRLRVAADGGHGVAGRLLTNLARELPLRLTRRNFDEAPHSDVLGRAFPDSGMLQDLGASVREADARFGAAFDFSGERIVFVDERGSTLRSDVAAGLIATELLCRAPGSPVAYDLRCTGALGQRVKAHNGQPLPGPVERVAFARHVRRTEAVYGADLSGLHHFKSFFRFPSPFVAFMLMCAHLTRHEEPVSELCADLRRFEQSGEVSVPMPSADAAAAVLQRVRDALPRGERELIDGVTVRMEGWWFNLRRPGKAPELRLNIEAADRRTLRDARRRVDSLVKQAAEAVAQG